MSYAATMGARQQRFAGGHFGDINYGINTSGMDISGGSSDPTGGGYVVPGAADPGVGSVNASFFSTSNASLGVDTSLGNFGSAGSNPYSPLDPTLGGAIPGGAASSNTGGIIAGLGSGIGAIIGAFTGKSAAQAQTAQAAAASYHAPAGASSSLFSGTTGVVLGLGALAALVMLSHRQPRAAAPSPSTP